MSELSRAAEMGRLHDEIRACVRIMLDNAIRAGELLTAQKAELKHGEWLAWVGNC